MDALITYGGNRVSYSALRSLASLGLKVAVADTGRVGMGQWSKYCKRSYICADPLMHAEAYIEDIVRILKDSGAHFLLPGLDDSEVLARYRDRLPEGVILPVASYDSIRKANDKNIMACHAKGLGVAVPEVIDWHSFGELEEKLKGADYPLVVKLRRGSCSRGIYYPADARNTLAVCKGLAYKYKLDSERMPVVQRRIGGKKWMVNCCYHEGRKIASFSQLALRERPVTGGVSTLRVSRSNEVLESWAEKLLDSLSWHGIAMVEFKYDEETGECWFIEINPRLWAAISHAPVAGVDMVSILYIASTQGLDKALGMVRPQKNGVISRWWMGDVALAFSEARRFRLLKALKGILPGGADVYDDLWMDDPGASIGLIAEYMAHHLDAKKQPAGLKRCELA